MSFNLKTISETELKGGIYDLRKTVKTKFSVLFLLPSLKRHQRVFKFKCFFKVLKRSTLFNFQHFLHQFENGF